MFEDLDKMGKTDGGKRVVSFFMALLIEVVIVLAIIITPLIFFSVLPDSELLTFLIAPPPPPPPPPPSAAPKVQPKITVDPGVFVAPKVIPTEIPPPQMDVPELFANNIPVITGISSGTMGADLGVNTLKLATEAPPPPPPPKAPQRKVSEGVLNARLIRSPAPVYPALAKSSKTTGRVTVEVEVDEDGKVVKAVATSGPQLLRRAAEDAVKQWQYSPTLLNGEPVAVTSTVNIDFKLN